MNLLFVFRQGNSEDYVAVDSELVVVTTSLL